MNILLVRVDDRFIHGQILESWIPHLNAQGVVVANDELAGDQIQKTIMSMAIPERIKLRIVSLRDATGLAGDCEFNNKRTFVIVSTIKDAYRLYTAGLPFKTLNIGNNKATADSRQISYSVWVDRTDLLLVRELIDRGIDVNLQSVPRERLIDMRSILAMVDQ